MLFHAKYIDLKLQNSKNNIYHIFNKKSHGQENSHDMPKVSLIPVKMLKLNVSTLRPHAAFKRTKQDSQHTAVGCQGSSGLIQNQ